MAGRYEAPPFGLGMTFLAALSAVSPTLCAVSTILSATLSVQDFALSAASSVVSLILSAMSAISGSLSGHGRRRGGGGPPRRINAYLPTSLILSPASLTAWPAFFAASLALSLALSVQSLALL